MTELGTNGSQLARLAHAFGLSAFDMDLVLITLAPELDLRYERLYAYLQDDVTRKRPSVDLALNLLCPSTEAKLARAARISPSEAPLVRHGLLRLIPAPNNVQPPLLAHSSSSTNRLSRCCWATVGSTHGWRHSARWSCLR